MESGLRLRIHHLNCHQFQAQSYGLTVPNVYSKQSSSSVSLPDADLEDSLSLMAKNYRKF
jgi:hypothetical protein